MIRTNNVSVVYGKDCSETRKFPLSITWFQGLLPWGLCAMRVIWQVSAPEAHLSHHMHRPNSEPEGPISELALCPHCSSSAGIPVSSFYTSYCSHSHKHLNRPLKHKPSVFFPSKYSKCLIKACRATHASLRSSGTSTVHLKKVFFLTVLF